MLRSRPAQVGLIIALLAVVGLALSLAELTDRLSNRNIYLVRLVNDIVDPTFEFQGHIATVQQIPSDQLRAEGIPAQTDALRITWRDQTADFPIPDNSFLQYEEGLNKYRKWFGVFVFVDGEESEDLLRDKWVPDDQGNFAVQPRLVVAARYTADGYEDQAETWGAVRRSEWVYRFAQFHPASTHPDSAQAITRWTKNYEELDNLLTPGTYTKKYRPHLLPESQAERNENLWMYYAMLQVTPASDVRGRNKSTEEVVRAMGWPWPVAAASALALAGSLALIASSRVARTRVID